jgi:hypothetical protein
MRQIIANGATAVNLRGPVASDYEHSVLTPNHPVAWVDGGGHLDGGWAQSIPLPPFTQVAS